MQQHDGGDLHDAYVLARYEDGAYALPVATTAGMNIKAAREFAGFKTQRAFAKELGVPQHNSQIGRMTATARRT